jgi:hypothetical protein
VYEYLCLYCVSKKLFIDSTGTIFSVHIVIFFLLIWYSHAMNTPAYILLYEDTREI